MKHSSSTVNTDFLPSKSRPRVLWNPHSSGQLTCQRPKWNWRPLVFLFDYSWGYFPMASLFALVKRFMKSAFRVDLRSIFTDDKQSLPLKHSIPPNGHQIIHIPWGIRCAIVGLWWWWGMTGKFKGTLSQGSSVWRVMTLVMRTDFVFSPHSAWLKTFLKMCVWSHSPTGMRWWVLYWLKWLDSKRHISPRNHSKLLLNCCQFSSGLLLWGCHSESVTQFWDVSSWTKCHHEFGYRVLSLFRTAVLLAAEYFHANFCPRVFLL